MLGTVEEQQDIPNNGKDEKNDQQGLPCLWDNDRILAPHSSYELYLNAPDNKLKNLAHLFYLRCSTS